MGVCWGCNWDDGIVYPIHCKDDCLAVQHPGIATETRTKFRKQANAADNKAATIIVDSLINYEAVKVTANPPKASSTLMQ